MKRRTLLAGTAALATLPLAARVASAASRTPISFWHAMTGPLADEVNKLCAGFNASQADYTVTPVFKGGYADVFSGVIAAWRAHRAPHIAQIFEVGTASMLAAGPAIKPSWQLFSETGVAFDQSAIVPAVGGYYALSDGKLASMPFNSSTAVLWINRDAFAKAGLDPSKPPATWPDLIAAARAIKAKNAAPIPMSTAWPTWIQFEEYAAIHNLPYATLADGYDGLGAKLLVNKKPFVDHLQRLLDMKQEGLFTYGGRDSAPSPLFPSGQAAMLFDSSSARGTIAASAKFAWENAFLPYDPSLIKTPTNSIIGGASLWTMTAPGRTKAEYKGVAEFYAYLNQPKNVAEWAAVTGYVPVSTPGYKLMQQDGYYTKNQGADLAVQQLARGSVTPNTRGIRLGRMPELRNIVEEEMENALQGKQNAQQALDRAVARGNVVLAQFQRSAGG